MQADRCLAAPVPAPVLAVRPRSPQWPRGSRSSPTPPPASTAGAGQLPHSPRGGLRGSARGLRCLNRKLVHIEAAGLRGLRRPRGTSLHLPLPRGAVPGYSSAGILRNATPSAPTCSCAPHSPPWRWRRPKGREGNEGQVNVSTHEVVGQGARGGDPRDSTSGRQETHGIQSARPSARG